jgi:hypothetical protein
LSELAVVRLLQVGDNDLLHLDHGFQGQGQPSIRLTDRATGWWADVDLVWKQKKLQV